MAITKAEKYRYNNNTFEISVLLKWIWILIKIIGEFLKVRRRKNINKYIWNFINFFDHNFGTEIWYQIKLWKK